MNPKVSVILCVYNNAPFLDKALQSVLLQSFRDFLLIVVEDGSTDASWELLQRYRDPRIVLVRNDRNRGIAFSANRGLDMALGEYVARMDGDDICMPDRLNQQVRYMDLHKEVDICGSWVRTFGAHGARVWRHPCTHDAIRARLMFDDCMANPTVIMRRASIDRAALRYDTTRVHGEEDYDFYVRAASECTMPNMPKVLLRYRQHGAQISIKDRAGAVGSLASISAAAIASLGYEATKEDLEVHRAACSGMPGATKELLKCAGLWFDRLLAGGTVQNNKETRRAILAKKWFFACYCTSRLGMASYRAWRTHALGTAREIGVVDKYKYLLRCVVYECKKGVQR